MDIQIKKLTPQVLDDYLSFFDHMTFEEHPDWAACYCFSFHFVGKKEEWARERNRSSVIDYVHAKKMTGYLAYINNQMVGWCNTNKRSKYQRLMKYYDLVDNPDDQAASIVCFLTHPDYRGKGIAKKMLEKICMDYSDQGYDYLEAYPGKGNLSIEENYKGPMSLYTRFGFNIFREEKDYYVMRKDLNSPTHKSSKYAAKHH